MKLARLPDGTPEIFSTIQGEGASLGHPSIFLRLSLCNLHCHWCDTDYTWNWEGTPWPHQNDTNPNYKKYNKSVEIIEIPTLEVAQKLEESPLRRLVITGGEPLLQQEELLSLIEILKSKDPSWFIEIETNGTISPTPPLNELIDQYNTSPKLNNSKNPEKLRLKPKSLHIFARSPKAWFKFVITDEQDLAEVAKLAKIYKIPNTKIILMPEALNPEVLQEKLPWLAQECLERNWRLSTRLHLQIWGNKRAT